MHVQLLMFAVYEPVMLGHNMRIGTFNCTITFAFIFTSENNRRSRFCRVIVMYMARNFSGAGVGRFEGSLIGAVLLKPCSRH